LGQNEQKALVAAMVAMAFSTLVLASAPRWAACVSAALAALAVVPLAQSKRELTGPRALLLLLAIPLIATAIQLLPLPTLVVKLIAPASYDLAAANAKAYGHSVAGLMPLSQDWPSTLVELAKFCGYFSFAYVCTRLCSSRRARSYILTVVACVGAAVAVCALGHRAVGAHSLFGFYSPEVGEAYKQSFSPFLNPNHLAGYMSFITPVCLGLAAHRRSWLFLCIALVCAATGLQAISRGGVVSLSVGVVVALVLIARSRSNGRGRGTRGRSGYWLALGLGVGFVALAVFGVTSGQELLHLDLQREHDAGKLMVWRSGPALLQSSPWVGIGRGAFEFSFTTVQPAIGATFSHIENEYLQALVDWGVLVFLALIGASILIIRQLRRRGVPDALAAGSIGALVAAATHSFVDFGLELPGMALPVIAVLATLLGGKLRVIEDPKRRQRVQLGRLIGVVASVAICALAASSLGARPNEDLKAQQDVFAAKHSGDADAVVAKASRLAARHPSSYLVPAKAAQALLHLRDGRAFAVLGRALDLSPNHYGVHLLAAHMLEASQEPRQALAEYRAALTLPGGDKRKILNNLAARFPATDDILLAIPRGDKAAATYGRLLLQMKQPKACQALMERTRLGPASPYGLFAIAVEAGLGNGDLSAAVEIGKAAHHQFETGESLLLYVDALRAAALPLIAIETLETHIKNSTLVDLANLNVLSQLQLDIQDFPAARRSSNQLLKNPDSSRPHRRASHLRLAIIEEHEGNRHQATWHREQAAELRER